MSTRIKAVRQAIGDDGAAQACIRTVRGRGFRVVATVTENAGLMCGAASEASPSINAGSKTTRSGTTTHRFRAAALAALVVAVLLGTAGWYLPQTREQAPAPLSTAAFGMPKGPGIAVLRFENPNRDTTLDFLEGALTEEIVTQLTRFSELRVAARALTSEYGRKGFDFSEMGRRLGVEFLVQGSVRRSGDRVRLTAQLIKARDGTLLWAETYDHQMTPADIFAVHEDIASKVVASVASISGGVIARQRLDQARAKPPRELSAYRVHDPCQRDHVARVHGRVHLAIRTCLEAAVEGEPDYAAAWAMLAWIHTFEFTQGLNVRAGTDPRENALAAARRAIELAPANSMARFAMARATI